ncbi:hypothetical protein QQF64_033111 [Cirrhinus molitorella]|uniref:Uncharacterized protein n=1 Tax=Cirrhinus molitorella TaxID=172907 RepID=A0ABR3MSZ0_9TELE
MPSPQKVQDNSHSKVSIHYSRVHYEYLGPAISTPCSTLLAALQSTSNARLAQSLRHMDRSEPFVVISLWRAYLTKAQRTATCRDEHAGARDWLLNTAGKMDGLAAPQVAEAQHREDTGQKDSVSSFEDMKAAHVSL